MPTPTAPPVPTSDRATRRRRLLAIIVACLALAAGVAGLVAAALMVFPFPGLDVGGPLLVLVANVPAVAIVASSVALLMSDPHSRDPVRAPIRLPRILAFTALGTVVTMFAVLLLPFALSVLALLSSW